jgi:RHH-type proline utilization regulon transcriptional repressor/proline dehydrogenase/delta 1-pyrroline-5-carboxylate dehydrogenase
MLARAPDTAADAVRYFESYAQAIEAIGRAADGTMPDRPESPSSFRRCNPRYEPASTEARHTLLAS